MAILVAVAGAVLGNALGIGGSLGWTIGAFIGNMLFGKKNVVSGPRLGDLTVTGSTYGNMRAIGFGTIRMAGNIIWSPGIKEHKHKSGGGKGGIGGGGPTQISYTYTVSLGIAFGEGPAQEILRLWANGKVIYDKRGDQINIIMKGLKFKFYPGDEEQLADPLILANKGAKATPAFRGTCYIVIDSLPLANFGNAIPNITAEIAYTADKPNIAVPAVSADVTGGNGLAVDFTRQLAYTNTGTKLRVFQLQAMDEERDQEGSVIFAADPTVSLGGHFMAVAPNGDLVAVVNGGDPPYPVHSGGNTNAIVSIDPNTLVEKNRFGYDSDGLDGPAMDSDRFQLVVQGVFVSMATTAIAGGMENFFLCASIFNHLGIIKESDMTYVWDSVTGGNPIDGSVIETMAPGFVGLDVGEGYVLSRTSSSNSTNLDIWKFSITIDGLVTISEVASFRPQDVFPGDVISPTPETAMKNVRCAMYDTIDDSIIFFVQQNSFHKVTDINGHKSSVQRGFWIKVRNGAIVWRTEVDPSGVLPVQELSGSRIQDSTFGYTLAHRGFQFDTVSGALLMNGTSPDFAPAVVPVANGPGFYDSVSQTYVGLSGGSPTAVLSRWYFGRASGHAAAIGDIITSLCGRVRLDPSDIDVTSLTGLTVPGYEIGQQMAARDAIAPLSTLFFFDGVESDSKLKFVLRGNTPVRTITSDHLAVVDTRTNEVLTETRLQEVDLPAILSLRFMDKNFDYQAGTQTFKRIKNPVPTMFSDNTTTLDYSIALDSSFALQAIEKLGFTAWIERTTYAIKTAWENIDLDPTDVIQINLADGTIFVERLTNIEMSVGYDLTLKGLSQQDGQYTSLSSAYGGEGVLPQTIQGTVDTKLILLDVPLLRDNDESPGRSYDPLYYTMGGYANLGWSAGTIFKSADDITYLDEGTSTAPMVWGTTVNGLGDPDDPFVTDYFSTVTVSLNEFAESLASVSYNEMANGANAAALLKLNGEVEIILFKNVTQNSDGTFTLDTLMRGRRGTDTMCKGHTSGEIFVMLDASTTNLLPLTLSELNSLRYFKAVGAGGLIEDSPKVPFTAIGRALKPYAPVHVTGSKDMSNNIALSWVRRTRVGGAWQEFVGTVPLSEDSEAYEIDIYSGSSVVRTVTGLSSPAYTYSAANQATDGFTPPLTSLKLAVYQISAQVGRGFVDVHTMNVE